MTEKRNLTSLLTGIGFSGLEAEVYLALLGEPGATGYRVAQLTGKPAPNTYKALDALRSKGAVLLDESTGSRSYTALPIGEYLDGLKRGIDNQKREIETALTEVAAPTAQAGLFKLTSAEQVYERVRGLLHSCRQVALVDAFPGPLEKLRPDIERAAKRGVNVFIKAYKQVEFEGCDIAGPRANESEAIKIWQGDWLNVVTDCTESVLAFLKSDGTGVNEAIWIRKAYLGLLLYNGMLNEFMLTRLMQALKPKVDIRESAPEVLELARRYSGMMLADSVVPKTWLSDTGRQAWKEQTRRRKEESSEKTVDRPSKKRADRRKP